eukprot:1525655-Amphidinium_carterae.1
MPRAALLGAPSPECTSQSQHALATGNLSCISNGSTTPLPEPSAHSMLRIGLQCHEPLLAALLSAVGAARAQHPAKKFQMRCTEESTTFEGSHGKQPQASSTQFNLALQLY